MSRRPLWGGILLGTAAAWLHTDPAQAPTDPSDPVAVAIAAGLDQGDALVERRLLRDMGFLGYTGQPAALLAEARRLGLHRSDAVVRRHLTLKLAAVRAVPPSADQLQAQQAALCVQPARYQIAEQPDRWLTARDLERQYPDGGAEVIAQKDAQPADSVSCRARAQATAWARQLRESLP